MPDAVPLAGANSFGRAASFDVAGILLDAATCPEDSVGQGVGLLRTSVKEGSGLVTCRSWIDELGRARTIRTGPDSVSGHPGAIHRGQSAHLTRTAREITSSGQAQGIGQGSEFRRDEFTVCEIVREFDVS